MRISAVICFVLAGVSTIAAVSATMNASETRETAEVVGITVGAFLLPMVFLIGGLSLARKPKE